VRSAAVFRRRVAFTTRPKSGSSHRKRPRPATSTNGPPLRVRDDQRDELFADRIRTADDRRRDGRAAIFAARSSHRVGAAKNAALPRPQRRRCGFFRTPPMLIRVRASRGQGRHGEHRAAQRESGSAFISLAARMRGAVLQPKEPACHQAHAPRPANSRIRPEARRPHEDVLFGDVWDVPNSPSETAASSHAPS